MMYTQKEIWDYLVANPLSAPVNVGDIDLKNGRDYIFLDYVGDDVLASDNRGDYRRNIQITIATKNFENRNILVRYVKQLLNVSVQYDKAFDFEYFMARCECGILMYEDDQHRSV